MTKQEWMKEHKYWSLQAKALEKALIDSRKAADYCQGAACQVDQKYYKEWNACAKRAIVKATNSITKLKDIL